LANTGIAGTPILFQFYWPMAGWLERRWPRYLHIEWQEIEHLERLKEVLPVLVPFDEAAAFHDFDFTPRDWIEKLKGPDDTDAVFLIRRLRAIYKRDFERESLHDHLNIPYRLEPGPDTPSRSRSEYAVRSIAFQTGPLRTARPDLRQVFKQKPRRVRKLPPKKGQELIDLAREAMVTHERDLDAFSYGNVQDVYLIEFEEGLRFAAIGSLPERRYLVPTMYGFLNLKNGVPIGYYQICALGNAAEVSFNTFSSYRNADASQVYARALSMTHHVFGINTFALDPFQLGRGNKEGIESGVWWFYYKLGFRPRSRRTRRLLRSELEEMKRSPRHRSSPEILNELAAEYMYFRVNPKKNDLADRFFPSVWKISRGVSNYAAKRFGVNRELGFRVCAAEAAERVGLRSTRAFSTDELEAWERWAPLILNLRGVERWSPADRRELVKVVRAKGGASELDFLHRFDRHERLRREVLRFAQQVEI
jgi:hypothetical protein